MKLTNQSHVGARTRVKHTKAASGLTLVEMAMAVGVGSLVLAVVGLLTVYALRSFAAMGNYASLDAHNRLALDKMTRDIREATKVVDCDPSGTIKWITFELEPGVMLKYTWYAEFRTLVCEKAGQEETYLTECDQWDFALYQRTPQSNLTNVFFPATNASGMRAPNICKCVELTWKCSRTLLGKKWNTESVQTTRIVLRNKQ